MRNKMKRLIGILLLLVVLLGLNGCFNTSIPKPDKLISKGKFLDMMVDIYLIQGLDLSQNKDTTIKKITQTDLYYSVLKKYEVPDTVFIRSLIYYASFPKEYEKMHEQIMNTLKESETQFKPKNNLDAQPK